MPAKRTCNCMTCPKCRNREERRRVYRLQAYGAWEPQGDMAAVIAHLGYLQENRVGVKRISEITGISTSTLSRIKSGKNRWVTKAVAEAILRIHPEATLRLDPTGTKRRIRALMALGWSTYYLAERLSMQQGGVWELSKGRRWVNRGTYERVCVLYDELSMTVGPSNITRIRAQRAGHAPPLAWDDIDDVNEQPVYDARRGLWVRDPELERWVRWWKARGYADIDASRVERILDGERLKSTPAEKEAAMRRWVEQGRSARSLALIQGWKEGRYVGRADGAA